MLLIFFVSGHTKRNPFWNPRWQAIKLLWFGIILEKIQLEGVYSKPTFNFLSSFLHGLSYKLQNQFCGRAMTSVDLPTMSILLNCPKVGPTYVVWPSNFQGVSNPLPQVRDANIMEYFVKNDFLEKNDFAKETRKMKEGKRKRFNNHILICHHCRHSRSHLW